MYICSPPRIICFFISPGKGIDDRNVCRGVDRGRRPRGGCTRAAINNNIITYYTMLCTLAAPWFLPVIPEIVIKTINVVGEKIQPEQYRSAIIKHFGVIIIIICWCGGGACSHLQSSQKSCRIIERAPKYFRFLYHTSFHCFRSYPMRQEYSNHPEATFR